MLAKMKELHHAFNINEEVLIIYKFEIGFREFPKLV
jgi:hypothetical protein